MDGTRGKRKEKCSFFGAMGKVCLLAPITSNALVLDFCYGLLHAFPCALPLSQSYSARWFDLAGRSRRCGKTSELVVMASGLPEGPTPEGCIFIRKPEVYRHSTVFRIIFQLPYPHLNSSWLADDEMTSKELPPALRRGSTEYFQHNYRAGGAKVSLTRPC